MDSLLSTRVRMVVAEKERRGSRPCEDWTMVDKDEYRLFLAERRPRLDHGPGHAIIDWAKRVERACQKFCV